MVSIQSSIKLKLPCEIVVRYLLPAIRSYIAKKLAIAYGLSQREIAKCLGVTQPAIHGYLNSNIGTKKELEECADALKNLTESIAKAIVEDKVDQINAMRKICSLCIKLRTGGPICKIHTDMIPLKDRECALCSEELIDEKKWAMNRLIVRDNVKTAVHILESFPQFAKLIPEISSNLVMAIKNAKELSDVVGVPGRINIVRGMPKSSETPEFGAATHVGNAVLTAMKFAPSIRSAINIKFDPVILKISEDFGLKISYFDRKEEPEEIKRIDGRTIPWGITQAVKNIGRVPDVVYDEGDVGKEPMIFLFAETAVDVVNLCTKIAVEYEKLSQGKD